MKLRIILLTVTMTAACVAVLGAAPQSDKQPIVSSTGRFGDPNNVARMYRDYMSGVIKELAPNEMILTKTHFGVDQTFKLTKKTKFTLDGKASSFDKLKVGDMVFVDVDTDKKTGDLTAKKVVSGADLPAAPTVAP